MKRGTLLSIGFLVLLSACSGKQTITYTLKISAPTDARAMELLQATERVMNRKMAAAKIANGHATALPTGPKTGTMTITVPGNAAADKVKSIIAQPFSFDLRIKKPDVDLSAKNTESDIWLPTALTGSNLESIQAIGNSRTGAVSIELNFTPSGRTMLESVFRENKGRNIGIFVRGLLVSLLSVQGERMNGRVVIEGIPSAPVAEVFADDVNVSLGVLFVPAP